MDDDNRNIDGVDLLVAGVITLIALLFIFWPGTARAGEIPRERGVYCVQGEAENQGSKGMLAVACAMRTRGTTKGVYGCNREVKHRARSFVQAVKAWQESNHPKKCKFIGGANSWRSWADIWRDPLIFFRYRLTYIYKGHLFFIEK